MRIEAIRLTESAVLAFRFTFALQVAVVLEGTFGSSVLVRLRHLPLSLLIDLD